MRKTRINVPDGTEYLSDIWDDLKPQLPAGHFIFDKKICGCGATEAYLRDVNQKTILASPRKQLLYNKYMQHLDDSHLYRFVDKEQFFGQQKDTPAELLANDDRLKAYVDNGGNKILVTYDSLAKVTHALLNMGQSLKDWVVVVDEMQAIFYDAYFKATTELEFTNATCWYEHVAYMSATPYLEEYLDCLSQFKHLPYVELVWPEGCINKPRVITTQCSDIYDAVAKIIDDYRAGNGVTTMINGETFTSTEAVIFVNSVQAIKNILKRNKLTPDEVDVICAGSNKAALQKLGYKIATIPGKDEARKMFTLCTSTVYLGADMYSPNAYTFIFANPQVKSMTLDVATDLKQIIGRQRLACNPFRDTATLYYMTKECEVSKSEFNEMMREKEQRSLEKIQNYKSAPHPEALLSDYENTVKVERYSKDFCSIVPNPETGKQDVVINELIIASEMRSWQIQHDIYNDDFSMCMALKRKFDVKQVINSDDPDVQAFFEEWNRDRNFGRRMRLFCDTPQDIIEKTSFIPKRYFTYYDALGPEGLQALSWREDHVKAALEKKPFNPVPKINVAKRVIETYKEGATVSRRDVKTFLQGLYDEFGVNKRATAEDINDYITVRKTINSGFQIVSHQRRFVSLFPQLTDTMNTQLWDIDKLLDVIKTDSYYNLRSKVDAVRKAVGKDAIDRKKSFLPLVCWNGAFKCRGSNLNNLNTYSSYTALDFDHFNSVKEMDAFKEQLMGIEWVYAVFVTPSGKGLKAIVQHDNIMPEFHAELYNDLLSHFDVPETDPHTKDLGRGNYLSYDPGLWRNPTPVSYHFEHRDGHPVDHVPQTYTAVKAGDGEVMLHRDDSTESSMLHAFCTSIISDRSVLNILRKRWESHDRSTGRNNRAFSYLGILCKAGIPKDAAIEFVISLFPDWSDGPTEIAHAAGWAYMHNPFGSERMKFKPHR